MTKSILGTVIGGIMVGALAFFVPHLLVGLFIFAIIIRTLHFVMGHGYHGHGHRGERLFYLADKVRKMSDEEYAEFKQRMGGDFNGDYHRHGYHHSHCGCGCGCNCGCGSKSEKCDCESKKETKE